MNKMGTVAEAQNYQDYMIPHRWAADEEPEMTQQQQAIGGMKIEPTSPTYFDVLRTVVLSKVGLAAIGLLGVSFIWSAFKKN